MRRRSPLRNLLFAAITLLVFFSIVEIGLRLAGFHFTAMDQWVRQSNRALKHDAWFDSRWETVPGATPESWAWFLEYDPELLWITRHPNPGFQINARGFRGDPVPPVKASDEYRILVLGDSCAWGYGVGGYDTFSYLLERRLNHSDPHRTFRVINAGVPGYSSAQGRRYFDTRLAGLEPDLVITYFGRNDSRIKPLRWRGRSDEQLMRERREISIPKEIFRALRITQAVSYLAAVAGEMIPRGTGGAGPVIDAETVYMHQERLLPDDRKRVTGKEFVQNILAIARTARQRGAETLLLTIPVNPDTVGNYNAELRRMSRDHDLPLVDLAARFARENDYPRFLLDECHPSYRGHRLIADIIADALQNGPGAKIFAE